MPGGKAPMWGGGPGSGEVRRQFPARGTGYPSGAQRGRDQLHQATDGSQVRRHVPALDPRCATVHRKRSVEVGAVAVQTSRRVHAGSRDFMAVALVLSIRQSARSRKRHCSRLMQRRRPLSAAAAVHERWPAKISSEAPFARRVNATVYANPVRWNQQLARTLSGHLCLRNGLNHHMGNPAGVKRDFEVLEKRRLKAVRLTQKNGLDPTEVARRLRVSRQTVSRWRKEFRAGGKTALRKADRAGRKPELTETDRVSLAALLENAPEELGYETSVWTCASVADLIAEQFGIEYHPGHVWKILDQPGLESRQRSWPGQRLPREAVAPT